jgi:acetyltransferase
VTLNLPDIEALQSAMAAMSETLGALVNTPPAFLVQRMAPADPAAHELILGAKRDPHFGPILLVGHGGILVEVMGQVSLRMAPLTRPEVGQMIDELPGSDILGGVRGRKAVDRTAIEDGLLRLGDLMTTFPEVEQVDINPLVTAQSGALALDARIVLSGPVIDSPVP